MPTARDCHILVSHFQRKYRERYGFLPLVNRNIARWGFDSILMDLSIDEAKELIDYYIFKTISRTRHSIDYLFRHYEKIIDSRQAAIEDATRRAQLRLESQQRTEEWNKRAQ